MCALSPRELRVGHGVVLGLADVRAVQDDIGAKLAALEDLGDRSSLRMARTCARVSMKRTHRGETVYTQLARHFLNYHDFLKVCKCIFMCWCCSLHTVVMSSCTSWASCVHVSGTCVWTCARTMTYLRHDDRDRDSEQLGVVREAQRVVTCPSAGHESDAHVLEQRVTCANRMHGNKNVWMTGAIIQGPCQGLF
jgi:hypothetical protein